MSRVTVVADFGPRLKPRLRAEARATNRSLRMLQPFLRRWVRDDRALQFHEDRFTVEKFSAARLLSTAFEFSLELAKSPRVGMFAD